MKKLFLILLLGGCATQAQPYWLDKQAAVVSTERADKVLSHKVVIYPTKGEQKLLAAAAHQPTAWRLFKSLDSICKIETAKTDFRKGWKYEYEFFSDVTGKLVSRVFYTAKECDIEADQTS